MTVFHDPDLMPFQPRKYPSLGAMLRNYLENFPPASYTEGYCELGGLASIIAPTVFLTDPELIEDILVKRADIFVRDQFSSRAMRSILDQRGMFLSEGADWRWQRRAVSPAFRYENLLTLVPIFVQCANAQVEEWRRSNLGTAQDVTKAMTRTTIHVIQKAVLGDPDMLEREAFLEALKTGFEGLPWQELLAFLRAPSFFPSPRSHEAKIAVRFLMAEMAKAIATRRVAAPGDRNDILALLLSARDPETGRVMNDAELTSNLYTLIAAGHETTAMALGWALWLLAKDQSSQDRLREEAVRVAAARDFTAKDVEALVFTKQVIQETMRLFPPVTFIGRQALEDTKIGPHAVSKKAQILVPVWSLHRNTRLWEDPMAFDPNRFTPEKAKVRHSFAFIPFGAGPRICIGMNFALLEMSAILATLVREFRFKEAQGFHPKLAPNITLRPDSGLLLLIEAA
jgi:cytochrome P450